MSEGDVAQVRCALRSCVHAFMCSGVHAWEELPDRLLRNWVMACSQSA